MSRRFDHPKVIFCYHKSVFDHARFAFHLADNTLRSAHHSFLTNVFLVATGEKLVSTNEFFTGLFMYTLVIPL